MDINLQELKELTLKAKEEGVTLRKLKVEEDLKAELLMHEVAKGWAESYAKTIPNLCKEAARKGKSKALIVTTKNNYNAVYSTFPHNEFHGWNTKSVDGLKYHYLTKLIEDAGLTYEIGFNHDGVGITSWFEIYITWD